MKTLAATSFLASLHFAPGARPRATLVSALALTLALGSLSGCSTVKNVFGSDNKAAEAPVETADAAPATAPAQGGSISGGAFTSPGAPPPKFISQGAAAAAPAAPAPSATSSDTPPPKFSAPKSTGKGAPSLDTVPTKAPTPPSSREDREKTTEGLLADRDKARYTDQGGRTVPVAVRPLTDTAAALDAPSAPPKPQAAKVEPVTRLGAQPAPGQEKPKDSNGKPADGENKGETKTASVSSAAALAAKAKAPPPVDMTGPRPSMVPASRNDGFKPLGAYDTGSSAANQVATIDFVGAGSVISPINRRALSDAAKLGERAKGRPFRVIGRASDQPNVAQERATAVARELQRLGVAPDRIYVGTDTGTDGRVDVILDQ